VVRHVLDEAVALETVELDLPARGLARPGRLGLAERVARDLWLAPRASQEVSCALSLRDRDDVRDRPRVDADRQLDVADARVDHELAVDARVLRLVERRHEALGILDAHARSELCEAAWRLDGLPPELAGRRR